MKGFVKFKYYGPMEWMASIIGTLVSGRTTYQFMIGKFDEYEWSEYLMPVGAVCFGLILMSAPLDILDWFRKKFGMPMKNNRIESDNDVHEQALSKEVHGKRRVKPF